MAKAKSSTRKLIFIIGGILITLVIFGFIAKKAGWIGGKKEGKMVETAQAKRRTITQTVSASGTIEPVVEVKISPTVSGEIIDLPVIEGDYVKKGDLLMRIKPDLYQASIEQLQASLLAQKSQMEQNRANMIKAQTTFEQQAKLYKKGMVSDQDYVTAKSNYDAAQASYKASQYQVQNMDAQLRRAQEELQQTIIRSPMDGTISQLNVKKGETVVGSNQMQGTDVMHIAKMDQMEVLVDVNENDVVNVAPNDTAKISVDAYPDRTFKGVVTQIANSATVTGQGTTEQITNYQVKIRITSRHNEGFSKGNSIMEKAAQQEIPGKTVVPILKPGMTATVDIQTKTVHNVISVPIQAVTVRDYSKIKNKSKADSAKNDTKVAAVSDTSSSDSVIPKEDLRKVVFEVVDGKAKMLQVTTGISDDNYTEILTGVKPGEKIITGPYRILSKELSDGDPVSVNNKQFKALIEQ